MAFFPWALFFLATLALLRVMWELSSSSSDRTRGLAYIRSAGSSPLYCQRSPYSHSFLFPSDSLGIFMWRCWTGSRDIRGTIWLLFRQLLARRLPSPIVSAGPSVAAEAGRACGQIKSRQRTKAHSRLFIIICSNSFRRSALWVKNIISQCLM